MKKYEYILKELDCAACGEKIQKKIAEDEKYQNVIVNFNTLKLSFEVNEEHDGIKEEIIEIISKVEPEVEVVELNEYNECHNHDEGSCCHNHSKSDDSCCSCCNHNHGSINVNIKRIIVALIIAACAFICKRFLPEYDFICACMLAISCIVLLWRTGKNAIMLLKKKTINENFLVTISCIGAFLIGKHAEGLMVILLYEIGKILEDKAVNNSRKSIADLMDIKPEFANLKKENGDIVKVNPNEVNVGDVIVVKPGEEIPLDGFIELGNSEINTKSITGESKANYLGIGAEVLSGSISETGLLEIKVSKRYEDSTVSKVLNLVENATDKKAKVETFVSRASRIYTPIVVILAIMIFALLPTLIGISYSESFYRALIFLVVSCPCAIAISVPLSYFSGIGKASKNGILVKGSNYLDAIRKIKKIVFDKTGTLTKGKFEVTKIVSFDEEYDEDGIILYASICGVYSRHPINDAINGAVLTRHFENDKYPKINTKPDNYKETSGRGVYGEIEGKRVKLGNIEHVKENAKNINEIPDVQEVGTIVYLNIDDVIIGYIVLSDVIKPETSGAIEELKKQSISVEMFTGDNSSIALEVAKQLKIDNVKAEMLPQDKYSEMEKILEEAHKKDEKVAFVGDGINDSPVLTISDIGIAMGGVGASSAVEASDVVLMTDDISKINEAIRISKFTNKIIVENLVFALSIKIAVLILSAMGLAMMWQAVFADVGVTVLTILNTLRILKGGKSEKTKRE